MRLLHSENLKFVERFGSDIPEYAILSHTWVVGQELSFREAEFLIEVNGSLALSPWIATCGKSRTLRGKSGLLKILECCQKAQDDGWEYVWIDTCCIDQSSSSELSEAINSMYNWYAGSKVCYAYLADLGPRDWNVDPATYLRPSRWFTRGWTLQELLAPEHIVFYASDWSHIGTKYDLDDFTEALESITGIAQTSLLFDVFRKMASVAQRMSWAATRETTRPEDMAYCLMGLFNINMPLLYGEGAEAAFTRLQEQILRANNDHSIFAWSCRDDVTSQRKRETYRLQFSALLADRPDRFAKAGDVESVWDDPEPFAMTNLGLEINFKLQQEDDGIYGVLECSEGPERLKRLAVPLAEPLTYEYAAFDSGLDDRTWHECLSQSSKPMKRIARDNRRPLRNVTPHVTNIRKKLYIPAVANPHLPRPHCTLLAYDYYYIIRRTPCFQPTFKANMYKPLHEKRICEKAILGTYLDTKSHSHTLILLLRVYSDRQIESVVLRCGQQLRQKSKSLSITACFRIWSLCQLYGRSMYQNTGADLECPSWIDTRISRNRRCPVISIKINDGIWEETSGCPSVRLSDENIWAAVHKEPSGKNEDDWKEMLDGVHKSNFVLDLEIEDESQFWECFPKDDKNVHELT